MIAALVTVAPLAWRNDGPAPQLGPFFIQKPDSI